MRKIIFIAMMFLVLSSTVFAQTSNLEIVEYEKDILIERGWIRYLNVKVKNSGNSVLDNVEVFISGEKSYWFGIQTEKTSILPNQTESFMIKLYVPSEEEKGKYDFSLNARSGEASIVEQFTIRIFSSSSEMVLYQIQSLRDIINNLKQEADRAEQMGKNIESIKESLYEAESLLNVASSFVSNSLYDDATEKIIEAEDFIKKAEYDLSIPITRNVETAETIPLEWILIIILIIIIMGMVLFFVLTRHGVARKLPSIDIRKVSGIKPGLNIKKLMVERKVGKKTENEIKKLEEAESLLEEEYREGLISSESYEELKSKYEEKILDLRTKKTNK